MNRLSSHHPALIKSCVGYCQQLASCLQSPPTQSPGYFSRTPPGACLPPTFLLILPELSPCCPRKKPCTQGPLPLAPPGSAASLFHSTSRSSATGHTPPSLSGGLIRSFLCSFADGTSVVNTLPGWLAWFSG